jgi:hypothetical protein
MKTTKLERPARCLDRLVRWLFRCRHKWEANIYDGWECVEERCIKCNGHQHKPQFGEHGWQPGRLPKTHHVVIQGRNMGKTAALLADAERSKQNAVESAHKRGMIEAARLRGHITKMEGWLRQIPCQCSERSACARCMALACSEVDYPPNDERMRPYQRGRASITGLVLKLREIMATGRLVGVA